MKSKILALAVLGFGQIASASTNYVVDCWDGSFNYNAMSLVDAGNRYDFSMSGASIGPLLFESQAQPVLVASYNIGNKVYVAFKKSDCTIAPDGSSGRCEKNVQGAMSEAAYVDRAVNDLERDMTVISPVLADRVVMEFSKSNVMRLEFHGARRMDAEMGPDVQVAQIDLQYCGKESHHQQTPRFPERLINYLNRVR